MSDIAGTTRDSLIDRVEPKDAIPFWLVDTAGLTNAKGKDLEQEIQTQVEVSLENGDMTLFLVDGKKDFTADDFAILEKLRKSKKPVIFVANKIDDGDETRTYELSQHGLGMPLAVSAKNYTNIWELQEAIEEALGKSGFSAEVPEAISSEEEIIRVAFIGRPNVGKSSLLNAFLGQKRSVVSNIPGTTRDTIDTKYEDESGQKYLFLDTAGLRKPGKIGRNLEFWASVRTVRSLEKADVCVLLIDALDGVTHQDLAIAGKAVEAGKSVIIGVNKFDLVRAQSREEENEDDREVDEVKMWGEDLDKIRKNYLNYLHHKIAFLPWAPVLFFSAKTGKGIPEILESVKGCAAERKKRVSTSALNAWIPEIFYGHITPSIKTRQGKIKYASQVDQSPPKFIFHVNNTKAFHFSYRRYLENKIREKYGFFGTPIRIEMRDQMEEFRGGKKRR